MLTKNKRLFRFDSCLTLQNSFFFSFDIVFLLYRFRFFSLYFLFLLYRFRRFLSLDFVFLLYRFRFISLNFVFLLYRFRFISFSYFTDFVVFCFRFVSFRFFSFLSLPVPSLNTTNHVSHKTTRPEMYLLQLRKRCPTSVLWLLNWWYSTKKKNFLNIHLFLWKISSIR